VERGPDDRAGRRRRSGSGAQDCANGYETHATEFIARRSSIGAKTVAEWARRLPPGADVLELGCGDGRPITDALVAAGARVYGVDAARSMVTAFRARHPDVPVLCATAESADFFDRCFDAVVAWGLLFLLEPEAQRSVIGKVAGALKPGGEFLFTAAAQACTWRDAITGRTSQSLGAAGYRSVLRASGLDVVEELADEGGNHYYRALKPRVPDEPHPILRDRRGVVPRTGGPLPAAAEYPTLLFADRAAFRKWLNANHENERGVWLQIAKKGSGLTSIGYADALDVALCFGWIDGQTKGVDDATYVQKFTPRGKRSIWSKRNREHVERLIASGEMQPAGLAAIEAAKADGRWDRAYDSPATATVPDDFRQALRKQRGASALFESLSSSERFAFLYRIQTAVKPETRARRIAKFVELLGRGERRPA
jgi:uncharacterized protein YdeI (YjbR/CyaY-like superfamily)/trans-aconitate methyltransferase